MRTPIIACLTISVLAIGPIPSLADDFKRIMTAEEFSSSVVGKNFSWEHGTAVIHSNGKTDGNLNTQGRYYGNWIFSKGYYCRNLIIEGKETGTNCQTVEINGSQVRLTRDQGQGRVTVLSSN